MRHIAVKLTVISLIPILGFAYTNCSKVAFDSNEVSPDSEILGQQDIASGSILINEGAEFTNSEDVILRLEHNSAKEMYLTNNMDCSAGGNWEPYAKSKMWKLSAKNQSVKVYAKFRESSASPSSDMESNCYSDDIIHDDIAPVITIKRAAGSFFNTRNFDFEFSVTDSLSGVGVVRCDADAAWSTACTQAIKNHSMAEGAHRIKIEATDKAGNKAVPAEDNFVIDLTPPTLVFNSTPPAISGDATGKFAFSATDALSGVDKYECRPSSMAAFATCTSPSTATYPAGANSFQVRVYDRAGNVSAPITYNWMIDLSAPSVRITKGPDLFTNLTTAQFQFEGKEGSKAITEFKCKVDAAAYVTCTSPLNISSLSEGSHTFYVIGYDDVARASSPASYTWTIDRTKPTVTITAAPPSRTQENSGSFGFIATDGATGSGVKETQCSFDGASYAACNSPKPFTALPEGTHVFNVRAIDMAGNVSDPATYTWVIDNTKPIVVITSGPAAQVKDLNATLTFTASDPNGGSIAKVECRIDASASWEMCSSPKNYSNLAQGAHGFQVRATDSVGNISDIKSHSWFVDSIAPSIAYTSSASGSISSTTPVQITYTITDDGVGLDLNSIRCGLNGVRVSCGATKQINYPNLMAGNYVYRIEATDLIGNSGYKDITWSVKDNTVDKVQSIAVIANDKVDVLVVIDNSGSMAPKQANMATRFGSFLDKLSGLNWQVGIVTTDIDSDTDKRDGRLLEFTGMAGTYVINSTMNYVSAKTAFASTVQRPKNEGSGYEQGIAATYRSIERSLDLSININKRNAALFRQGAVLSVIVVTDADESPRSGTQYRNIPANLNNDIKTMLPGKVFRYNSIIVKPGDTACLNKANFGNEGYGYSYNAMSGLTNGVVGTVCSDDYGSQLAAIGQSTVELIKTANLECAPINGNIQVITSNGTAAPSYSISGLTVTFSAPLPVGNNQLRYTCIAN